MILYLDSDKPFNKFTIYADTVIQALDRYSRGSQNASKLF